MTAEQREQIKELIEAQIAQLEVSTAHMREKLGPVSPDSSIGRLSRTDSMMNAGTVGLALKDANARLTRLRNRLDRVEDETFDQCALCGKTIGMERLLAVPDRGICKECLNKTQKK